MVIIDSVLQILIFMVLWKVMLQPSLSGLVYSNSDSIFITGTVP